MPRQPDSSRSIAALSGASDEPARGRSLEVAVGLSLLVGAVYVLSGPGRVDIFDGQVRYEVARNFLLEGKPVIRDPHVSAVALAGTDGDRYSSYGFAGSVVALPLIALGLLGDEGDGELPRFLYTLTPALLAAAMSGALFLFLLDLGVRARAAIGWTLVSAFGTLLWPLAVSTFDNAQHAAFALFAAFFGHRASLRESRALALAGGACAGFLINYQETFALIVPALAMTTLAAKGAGPGSRRGWDRCLAFCAGAGVGLLVWMAYNAARFGNPLRSGRLDADAVGHPDLLGDPVVGLVSLLVSPGKSIALYSPPIVIALFGLRGLLREHRMLALAIVGASTLHLLLVSSLSFFGGDWCWGPRYLVVLLPLWALAMPFSTLGRSSRRTLVGVGIAVQLLAISLDHQRFFAERSLPYFVWTEDPGLYYRRSALFARIGELATLADGLPPEARYFSPTPNGEVTYLMVPFAPQEEVPRLMRQFLVFYLPRPWPLWLNWIHPEQRPVDLSQAVLAVLGLGLGGAGLILAGLRAPERERETSTPAA